MEGKYHHANAAKWQAARRAQGFAAIVARTPQARATLVEDCRASGVAGIATDFHRRRRLIRVNRQMLCGSLEAFTARLLALGLPGHIQTAFIERVNLTLRRSLAPLARRSWSLAQLPGELTLHLEWWRARFAPFRPPPSGLPMSHAGGGGGPVRTSKTGSAASARRSTPGSTLRRLYASHGHRTHSAALVGFGGAQFPFAEQLNLPA